MPAVPNNRSSNSKDPVEQLIKMQQQLNASKLAMLAARRTLKTIEQIIKMINSPDTTVQDVRDTGHSSARQSAGQTGTSDILTQLNTKRKRLEEQLKNLQAQQKESEKQMNDLIKQSLTNQENKLPAQAKADDKQAPTTTQKAATTTISSDRKQGKTNSMGTNVPGKLIINTTGSFTQKHKRDKVTQWKKISHGQYEATSAVAKLKQNDANKGKGSSIGVQ